MTVIVHIFMLIGNRKTPVKNLKILFSDAIGNNTLGQTSYDEEFKDVTITINPKLVVGPFDLLGTILHEVAHLVSFLPAGHRIETFYKYYICLWGMRYYELPKICTSLNFHFDFKKYNKISISATVK